MTPLGRVVLGLAIVFFDFRLDTVDVLADPVGWLVVLLGFYALTGRSPWFTGALVASAGGLVVSFSSVLDEPGAVLSLVHSVAETAVVFCTCTALVQLLAEGNDRRAADIIRWLDLGLFAVIALLYFVAPEREVAVTGSAAVPVVLLVIVGLGMVVWLLLLLLRVRRHEELQPLDV